MTELSDDRTAQREGVVVQVLAFGAVAYPSSAVKTVPYACVKGFEWSFQAVERQFGW